MKNSKTLSQSRRRFLVNVKFAPSFVLFNEVMIVSNFLVDQKYVIAIELVGPKMNWLNELNEFTHFRIESLLLLFNTCFSLTVSINYYMCH